MVKCDQIKFALVVAFFLNCLGFASQVSAGTINSGKCVNIKCSYGACWCEDRQIPLFFKKKSDSAHSIFFTVSGNQSSVKIPLDEFESQKIFSLIHPSGYHGGVIRIIKYVSEKHTGYEYADPMYYVVGQPEIRLFADDSAMSDIEMILIKAGFSSHYQNGGSVSWTYFVGVSCKLNTSCIIEDLTKQSEP